MKISVPWLNRYLDPGDVSTDEAERVLTLVGFPIEERLDGDVLDVEVTSNRGDALGHVGLAREIAAATGRKLIVPEGDPEQGRACADETDVEIRVDSRLCPRFTSRVIKGVKVGPSPPWLVEALESVGLRSVNNVVDVTNYVLLELGHPSHVFDLATLAERRIVVRKAFEKERLVTLDDHDVELHPDDVVVADAERARSLAGVIGGLDSGVAEKTTDVLLEVATWDPVTVRTTARRHRIATDASHRFERVVPEATIDHAAERALALIREVAGGERLPGAVTAGRDLPAPQKVRMRAARCRSLLGVDIPTSEQGQLLSRLGFAVTRNDASDTLEAEVPPFRRHDVRREADLIEEIVRMRGYDAVPIHEKLATRPTHPQESERALRRLGEVLTGMGFFETVTFSFVTPDESALFMPKGLRGLAVDEERRKEAPALRPSALPSLLDCRQANQNAGVTIEGGVRLFETSAVFAQTERGESVEHRNVTLLVDAPDPQEGLRRLRGACEALVRELGGAHHELAVEPSEPHCDAFRADAFARVSLDGAALGCLGLLDLSSSRRWGLDVPLGGAELNLDSLLALYPPEARAEALPAFPAIERDLSVVVNERTPWADVERVAKGVEPDLMVGLRFVGVYRGKPLATGEKSVTFRLRFRHPERTLRHEEVDPQVESVVAALQSELGGALRA